MMKRTNRSLLSTRTPFRLSRLSLSSCLVASSSLWQLLSATRTSIVKTNKPVANYYSTSHLKMLSTSRKSSRSCEIIKFVTIALKQRMSRISLSDGILKMSAVFACRRSKRRKVDGVSYRCLDARTNSTHGASRSGWRVRLPVLSVKMTSNSLFDF